MKYNSIHVIYKTSIYKVEPIFLDNGAYLINLFYFYSKFIAIFLLSDI